MMMQVETLKACDGDDPSEIHTSDPAFYITIGACFTMSNLYCYQCRRLEIRLEWQYQWFLNQSSGRSSASAFNMA